MEIIHLSKFKSGIVRKNSSNIGPTGSQFEFWHVYDVWLEGLLGGVSKTYVGLLLGIFDRQFCLRTGTSCEIKHWLFCKYLKSTTCCRPACRLPAWCKIFAREFSNNPLVNTNPRTMQTLGCRGGVYIDWCINRSWGEQMSLTHFTSWRSCLFTRCLKFVRGNWSVLR